MVGVLMTESMISKFGLRLGLLLALAGFLAVTAGPSSSQQTSCNPAVQAC